MKNKASDSIQVQGAVQDYLKGNIGRRAFLRRLSTLGFSATAAGPGAVPRCLPRLKFAEPQAGVTVELRGI